MLTTILSQCLDNKIMLLISVDFFMLHLNVVTTVGKAKKLQMVKFFIHYLPNLFFQFTCLFQLNHIYLQKMINV